MKNETIKNEEANQQEALLKNSQQSPQQELPPHHHARWLQTLTERQKTALLEEIFDFFEDLQDHYS